MSSSAPSSAPNQRRELLKMLYAESLELSPDARPEYICSYSGLTGEEQAELLRLLSYSEAESFFQKLSAEIGSLASVDYAFAPGDVAEGRFRIRRFIAAGGMGEVYEAEHLELGGSVALKVLRPALSRDDSLVETFRREIRLSREIVSPNVCNVYDVGRQKRSGHPDVVFFTMELLNGETLSARIARGGPLDPATARLVVAQLLDGLSAAHAAQVLHLDFKSGNVILCPKGDSLRVVITDFGIAKRLGGDALLGDGAHTPSSAAPEQLDRRPETPATDVFAFGVVLYEIVAGKLPFSGRKRTPPVPPRSLNSSLSRRWESVILRCLEFEPQRRYQSFSEVRQALNLGNSTKSTRRAVILAILATTAGAAGIAELRSNRPSLPAIAVFPFDWDTPVPADTNTAILPALLADRMTDLLIRLPGLRVISRSVSSAVYAQAKNLRMAGQELKANTVITGRLGCTAAPEVYALHLELADISSGATLWSQTNTGTLTELDAAYRDAVRSIADALELDKRRAVVLPASAGTRDPVAWQSYLLARYHAGQRDSGSVDRAIALCRQAIQRDPSFAAAHSWLGFCLFYSIARNGSDSVSLRAASDVAAKQALALNEADPDAHTVLGLNAHFMHWDWRAAEWHFQRAIALSPGGSLGHHRYARLLNDVTRFSEALQESAAALDLDPQSTTVRIGRGMILTNAGRVAEGVALLESLAGSDPGHFNVYVPLSNAYVAAGRLSEALQAAREGVIKSTRMSFTISQEGYVRGLLGDREGAYALASELEGRFQQNLADPGEVAAVHAGLKDPDATLNWLERGLQSRSLVLPTLRSDSMYRFLKGNERYEQLVRKVGLPG